MLADVNDISLSL